VRAAAAAARVAVVIRRIVMRSQVSFLPVEKQKRRSRMTTMSLVEGGGTAVIRMQGVVRRSQGALKNHQRWEAVDLHRPMLELHGARLVGRESAWVVKVARAL